MYLVLLISLFNLFFTLNAQIMYDTGEITAVDTYPTSYDAFGNNVAIDGDYAIVGAEYHKHGGAEEKGAAYIYHWNGTSWIQQAKLVAFDAEYGDWFGSAVDISGNYAIVGAHGDEISTYSNAGSAYIYKRNGTSWNFHDKIFQKVSQLNAYSDFGRNVAIDGEYAVITAPQDDMIPDDNKGAVYFYHNNGNSWDQQVRLTAADAYNLGNCVAIYGDYALVGCSNKGYVYSYIRGGTTWYQAQKFQASSLVQYDEFGVSVSIGGIYAVVGGTAYNYGEGAAYVFRRSGNTYSDHATIHPVNGSYECSFGRSVSISGDKILVGQTSINDLGDYAGSAYLFVRNGTSWNREPQLFGANINEYDNYGTSVAVSGDKAIIGAPYAYGDQPDSGTAFGYSLNGISISQQIPIKTLMISHQVIRLCSLQGIMLLQK